MSRGPIDRHDARVPFFAPVVVSGLGRCWATNISAGGVGLTALVDGASPPARGDELELELPLGDSGTTIAAIVRVAWTSLVGADGRVGLGAQFHEMSQPSRAQLAVFLAEHRPRALVAVSTEADRELVRDALGELDVELVPDLLHVDESAVRSCASLLLFCDDAALLARQLDHVAAVGGHAGLPGDLPLPPVTACTTIESDTLLPMLSAGRIYQVLRRPLDLRTLRLAIERGCERWALQLELRWASLQLESMTKAARQTQPEREVRRSTSNVVRESPAMRRVYELIHTVAVHDVPVLLQGETGTGKEVAARELHATSKRAKMPFVAQDCGALTETLLESELFGHVRGAFTGATTDNPGLFQVADGGTIFLDEIQNTSPTLQAKLLRVVEHGEVRPVGGPKPRRVDVRLIAACNVDLRTAIKEQRFRADFFYRLNRFPIFLPPLREHPEDIIPLAHFFVATLGAAMGRTLQRIDPRVERTLLSYPWPGNIRELRNAIERALLLTPDGDPLRWETLPAEVRGEGDPDVQSELGLEAQVDAFERRIIQGALDQHEGVIRRAARVLAVNPVTLSRRMKKLGML